MRPRTILPARNPLHGDIALAGDKSVAHRAVLLGAVAEGTTRIENFPASADPLATLAAVRALGVGVRATGRVVEVAGRGFAGLRAPAGPVDCANSGTTMRLLAGLLAGRPFTVRLDGDASLRRRPMRRVVEPLRALGAEVRAEGEGERPPLVVTGARLRGIEYRLPVASAQVKSAVLLAGLQAEGETRVVEPVPSRDHTERLLGWLGVRLRSEELGSQGGARGITVPGGAVLAARDIPLPGDLSSAAFFVVAALVVPGSRLRLKGVGLNPTRTGLLDLLGMMGARISVERRYMVGPEQAGDLVVESGPLAGIVVDGPVVVRAIDELPVFFVAAALARGRTAVRGAGELRVKESDRLRAMASGLVALGVKVDELPDGLVIEGRSGDRLRAGEVASAGDHRVAMALAVAALRADGPVTIGDPECADVSFPGFYDLLSSLAGAAGEG